jgi:hypothetical protein
MKKITLIGIRLNQFDNYQTSTWVKSLIFLSSDFFPKKKVINGTLFLESDPIKADRSLELLNEASSMDFSCTIYEKGIITIEVLEQILGA